VDNPIIDEAKALARELGALPCPFCGGAPLASGLMFGMPTPHADGKARSGASVCCVECRASTTCAWDDEGGIELAVRRWNRRTGNANG
jgi:hypothetical protein